MCSKLIAIQSICSYIRECILASNKQFSRQAIKVSSSLIYHSSLTGSRKQKIRLPILMGRTRVALNLRIEPSKKFANSIVRKDAVLSMLLHQSTNLG